MKKNQRKSLVLAALVALVAGFSSCSMMNKDASFAEGDLIGYWQQDGKEVFLRFTNEKDTTAEFGSYKYGYEWDEADQTKESDLLADKHGNGWFMWKVEMTALKELHLMSNGGAKIPKNYTITKLTDTDLQYQDDYTKYSFKKVVNKK